MPTPHDLGSIGWPPGQPFPDLEAGQQLVRITGQHRNGFDVHDGLASRRAHSPRGMVADSHGVSTRPAVGDWTIIDPAHTPAALVRLLPRRNLLKRGAAGERYQQQILATNLDLAVVVMGLDGDFNPRRLQRYLALIAGTGIEPVIMLSKADRCENTGALRAQIESAHPDIPVLAINCKDADAIAPITARLGPGRTGVLLGSSGAGKSTLTNTLMGTVRQKTSAVREHDSRGRHTTTSRSLLKLPSGGCLIDSPGMRELKLTGEEVVEDDGFAAELEKLAADCRFRDCKHQAEPGCAIQAALESGALDRDRYDHFRKLESEREHAAQQRDALLRRAEERQLTRALNHRLIDKHGRR